MEEEEEEVERPMMPTYTHTLSLCVYYLRLWIESSFFFFFFGEPFLRGAFLPFILRIRLSTTLFSQSMVPRRRTYVVWVWAYKRERIRALVMILVSLLRVGGFIDGTVIACFFVMRERERDQ